MTSCSMRPAMLSCFDAAHKLWLSDTAPMRSHPQLSVIRQLIAVPTKGCLRFADCVSICQQDPFSCIGGASGADV